MFELTGRVALVTGAGQNQGAGIARALARRGAAVAVNDLHAERAERVVAEIRASGGRASAAPFDVTGYAAVADGTARVARELGAIDVLVNNAGIPEGMGVAQFRDTQPEAWRPYIDVNVYGVMNCVRAVLASMRERRFGRIVIGLGLITLALQLIVAATKPLTESAAVRALLFGVAPVDDAALARGRARADKIRRGCARRRAGD